MLFDNELDYPWDSNRSVPHSAQPQDADADYVEATDACEEFDLSATEELFGDADHLIHRPDDDLADLPLTSPWS